MMLHRISKTLRGATLEDRKLSAVERQRRTSTSEIRAGKKEYPTPSAPGLLDTELIDGRENGQT